MVEAVQGVHLAFESRFSVACGEMIQELARTGNGGSQQMARASRGEDEEVSWRTRLGI